MKNHIFFSITYQGQTNNMATHARAYRSLMDLIKDNIQPDDFGPCGGQGRCGQCVVDTKAWPLSVRPEDSNEAATLLKHNLQSANCRLSCQIMISEEINGAHFEVMEP